MSSAINASFPVTGSPTTSSVRANFSAAKSEIETLQSDLTTEISDRIADVDAEEATRIAQDAILAAAITALGTPVHETKGTWTPVSTAATPGNWAVTYTTQLGFWHRIGDRIFFDCILVASAVTHTTASGQILVTGLPLASKNTASRNVIVACEWDGLTFTSGFALVGRILPNTTQIQFILSNNANGGRALLTGDHTTGNGIVFMMSGSYEV
jgi:hypothetical protein